METTNSTSTHPMVTGMFADKDSTERAYNDLKARGYSDHDINIMMSDDTRKKHFAHDHTDLGNKAMEGAGTGSAIGGTVGAIAAAIAAIGTSLIIPGLGLVVAGPIAAALAGAGAGGLTGGIVGALVGSGIPKEKAHEYEEGVKNGHIVLGVNPRNAEDETYFNNEWKSNQPRTTTNSTL